MGLPAQHGPGRAGTIPHGSGPDKGAGGRGAKTTAAKDRS